MYTLPLNVDYTRDKRMLLEETTQGPRVCGPEKVHWESFGKFSHLLHKVRQRSTVVEVKTVSKEEHCTH